MSNDRTHQSNRDIVAIGPERPTFGSWNWIGAEMAAELSEHFTTCVFREQVPDCDAVIFIKSRPAADRLRELSHRAAVIYCPVDFFHQCADVDRDRDSLRSCNRIVIHCEPLRKHFSPYAAVEYIDHHLKFATPMRETFHSDGPLLWVGALSNLPTFVEWANRHRLPAELWVLTNPQQGTRSPQAAQFGFRSRNDVKIGLWTHQRHRAWTERARAAIDIKAADFRARHKPPAKAFDFIASGVPFALNSASAAVEQLRTMGFQVASPEDPDHWLSPQYWQETVTFGQMLRRTLTRERIGLRWKQIIEEAIEERRGRLDGERCTR